MLYPRFLQQQGSCSVLVRVGRFLLCLLATAGFAWIGYSTVDTLKFDIPEGQAKATLRAAARQADVDIVFTVNTTEGLNTRAIRGAYTIREALDRMLEGTSLEAVQDSHGGAFAIVCRVPDGSVSQDRRPKELNVKLETERQTEMQSTKKDNINTESVKNGFFPRMVKVLAAVAAAGAFQADAQQGGTVDEAEDVFELSPFTVDGSQDTGYRANNTLTGSRLNTSLRDTASSVSVFTQEFLADTGLTDLEEIIQYSVGSKNDVQDINAGGDINNHLGAANPLQRVRIRGIRATKGVDYFQSFIPDDGYRADRYDESRGPNGILFGISEAGGIINTSTLRAGTQKDSGRIKYSTGSYERNRAEVRFNKVLIEDKLGIAVAGLHEDNGGWRDYEVTERDRYYGAITWKPTDRITFSANYEKGEHWETRIRPFLIADKFLPLYLLREKFGTDAVTFNVGRGSDYGNETTAFEFDGRDPQERRSSNSARSNFELRNMGLRTLTARTQERYIYNATDDVIYNAGGIWESDGFWRGETATLDSIQAATSLQDVYDAGGSGIAAKAAERVLNYEQYGFPYPINLNAAGPDMYRGENFETYSASLDFKFAENLFLNIAHNKQISDIDAKFVAGTEPELRLDPNRLLRHPRNDDVDPLALNPRAGDLYFDSYWRKQVHNIDSAETRAALSYDLDLRDSKLGRHRIAAGWSNRETSQQLVSHRWNFLGRPFNSDFNNTRNRVAIRTYLTEGDTDTYVIGSPQGDEVTVTTDDGVERKIGWVRDSSNTQNGRSDITVDSQILALQDYFFNGKLVTTFGYRKDDAANIGFGRVVDPIYGQTLVTGPDAPDAPGYSNTDFDAITRTRGVVFHINDKFSLLGNSATSIGLPEFRNIVYPTKSIPPPVKGDGYDVGIGFNLMENKISGRLIYFETEALNRTSSGGGSRIISDPLTQSMRGLDQVRNLTGSDLMVVKADGNPYTDAEWAAEVADLNGAVDGGVRPTQAVNAFLQDEFSNGYELSLTANVTENWRLTLNASYTDRILLNFGREFAKAVGWQEDENGRYIEPITVNANRSAAIATDTSLYIDGSINQRIVDIANRVTGTFVDEDGTATALDGNGSLFINTDGDYDSVNPDETIAYRAWQSLSGDSSLQENIDEREKRWGLNPVKFNLFTAYDFSEGRFKGFTLGGGYRWQGGAVIGQDVDGNEFTNSSQGFADLLMRYRQKLKNGNTIDYQVNVYNLLDNDDINPVRHSVLEDPTSRLSRYDLPTPREARVTVTYSF